ncbi:MAG: GFA family protein [Lysobacterales bacterium]|nr:MAG: GFA family protein [Xanthomonadales bacterium]
MTTGITSGGSDSASAPAGADVRPGGCLCGAVRYRIALPPKWVAHCHCSMCRRAQGAGFVTWVGVPEGAFMLESGADVLSHYKSSPAAVRSFCSRCGTPLFFQSTRWPGEMHVTLATLDSADGLEPQAHSYWSVHAEWADWRGRELPRVEPDE